MNAEECDDRLVAVLSEHIGHFVEEEAFNTLLTKLQEVQDETAQEYAAIIEEELEQARKDLFATTARLTSAEHSVGKYVEAYAKVSALALKIEDVVGRSKVLRFLLRWRKLPEAGHIDAVARILTRLEAGEPASESQVVVELNLSKNSRASARTRRRHLVEAAAGIAAEIERLS